MAKKDVASQSRWVNGISDFQKEGEQDSYSFGRGIDHRSDPRSVKLNPKAIKESGSIIEDLPKWGEIVGTDMYSYGDTGKIYKRTSAGVHTKLRQAPISHGNGLSYFGEDDFLYYTTDKVIGRYGPLSGTPQFNDDFLGSQGGVPLNTNALYLDSASSQYAYRADTATLSITGDLALEAQLYPLSLPASGTSQTIMSKWNESGNLRSYKFDITTQSNYFGDGSDGALTISVNTTEAPIDSACTGTIATTALTATNASFAAGQIILIHQTQGTGAGTWQRNKIVSYTAGTITLDEALNATYGTGAQVRVLKQYTDVTIDSGKTYTAKAWNGTVGGILAFLASGTVTVTGTISAEGTEGATASGTGTYTSALTTGGGFRGAGSKASGTWPVQASRGESNNSSSWNNADYGTTATGSGGGGGYESAGGGGGNGGGGAHATAGITGGHGSNAIGGAGSTTLTGSSDLTTLTFGGGGGGSTNDGGSGATELISSGGSGGGIVFIAGVTVTITGTISANGGAGGDWAAYSTALELSGGGGGAGGSILLKCQTGTLGSGLITASGGNGTGGKFGGEILGYTGGDGGTGRIHIDYYTSYTGTTTPTINATQDDNLGAADGYVLRLQLSADGTAVTTFSKTVPIATDIWQHVGVSFDSATTGDASKCSAEFFYNGVSLGETITTTQTIDDNASEFFIGTYKDGTGTVGSFYNGYIDEARVFSQTMAATDFIAGMSSQILTTLPGLNAYYKFNGDVTDATANANNLTASGSPTYVTNVPFSSPTTRLDIDQSATTTGDTYTMTTSISEAAAHRKTFTPQKDPQKSIGVLVASIGTGDWTLTVHNQYNDVIATSTIVNSALAVGYNEFVFATPWRPLINADYHFHLTSTVADGTVTTTSNNDLSTVSYRTYFQFLVTDTEWHPVARMLQFLVFGNERYVGTYEATLYDPNYITLPAGYRVRCFGYYKEYLAIGTMRGSTITEQDQGRIYFWDGIASTYNFYMDVPEGGINAILGSKGMLYVIAGYQGQLLAYSGGDSAEELKQVPLVEESSYMEVYPQAMTMWKTLLRFGVAGASDSTTIQRGVYAFGSQNMRYTDSLSYDYVLSTGTITSNAQIGLLIVVNKKLLIGYQDNVSYGFDYITPSNDPVGTGEIQMLLTDLGAMYKEKEVLTIVANFEPLNSGESVDIKYKLDRATDWTYLGAVTTVGATNARFVVATDGSRFNEILYGADLATTTTTSPKLLSLTMEFDKLDTETRIG